MKGREGTGWPCGQAVAAAWPRMCCELPMPPGPTAVAAAVHDSCSTMAVAWSEREMMLLPRGWAGGGLRR